MLRVFALLIFFGELKVMWSETEAAYQSLANCPAIARVMPGGI